MSVPIGSIYIVNKDVYILTEVINHGINLVNLKTGRRLSNTNCIINEPLGKGVKEEDLDAFFNDRGISLNSKIIISSSLESLIKIENSKKTKETPLLLHQRFIHFLIEHSENVRNHLAGDKFTMNSGGQLLECAIILSSSATAMRLSANARVNITPTNDGNYEVTYPKEKVDAILGGLNGF
jgi:hypothetical protein